MTDCHGLIDAMRRNFSVEHVRSPDTLRAAQRLRYQVFCHERNILPGCNGIETDAYDERSRHVVLRHRGSGQIVGTVRLVAASRENLHASFPMQRICDPALLRALPLATTGEVSRFSLARDRQSSDGKSELLLRLGLMRGVLRASRELGLTHWCAAMERSLLRLLRTAGVGFEPVGPVVDYCGPRQPAIGVINAILDKGQWERPAIWDYVTDSGELATDAPPQRIAA